MRNESKLDTEIAQRGYARRSVTPDEYETLEKRYNVRIFGECGLTNGKRIIEIRRYSTEK